MKKQLLGMAVSLALTSGAFAGDYDFEVRGGIANLDPDYGDSIEQYGAGGTVYFNTVNTDKVPLAEAAFLNRTSNIYGDISYAENTGNDVTRTNLGVEVFVPNTILYGAFNYNMIDASGEDQDAWSAKLGITPIEGLLLTTSTVEDVDYDPNIQAKYVMGLGGDQTLNLHGALNFSDSTTFYSAGMDYYFTTHTSLGFDYSDTTDSDTIDSVLDVFESYTVRGKHFFDESVYLAAQYTHTEFANEVGLDVGVRF